jgi:hypothetical protein
LRAFPGSAWGARDGLYPGKHLLRGTRAAPRPACPHWARTGGREARAEWGLGPPGPALRGRGSTAPTSGPRAFGAGGTLAPHYGAGGALPPRAARERLGLGVPWPRSTGPGAHYPHVGRGSWPENGERSGRAGRAPHVVVGEPHGCGGAGGREWATAGGQEVGDALLLARAGGCWPSRVTGPAGCRGGPRPASPRPCPSAAARPGRRSTTARLGPGRSPGPCRHRGTARGTTAPP